jgi:hypothetical protein
MPSGKGAPDIRTALARSVKETRSGESGKKGADGTARAGPVLGYL